MSCTARTYGCGFVLGLGFWDGGLGLAVLLPTCFSLAVLPRDREAEGERERHPFWQITRTGFTQRKPELSFKLYNPQMMTP